MKVNLSKYNQDWYHRKNGLLIILWWFIQGTIFRFSLHNMYSYRAFILRLFGAKIGKNVKIRNNAKFYYPWNVIIGDNSWIGNNVYFYSLGKINIGENSVISQNTYLNTGSHDIHDEKFGLIVRDIKIESGVWVGANCFINYGVTVKQYAVIAAMSNVVKDIPENMVCCGNPCKVMKKRFEY